MRATPTRRYRNGSGQLAPSAAAAGRFIEAGRVLDPPMSAEEVDAAVKEALADPAPDGLADNRPIDE